MNSLYGKFALNPDQNSTIFIDSEKLDSYLDKYNVLNYKTLHNNKLLI